MFNDWSRMMPVLFPYFLKVAMRMQPEIGRGQSEIISTGLVRFKPGGDLECFHKFAFFELGSREEDVEIIKKLFN